MSTVSTDNESNKKQWINEPDYKEFIYKGYKCTIRRIPIYGHLSGYVHIPKEKYHGRLEDIVDVHGEITYSESDNVNYVHILGFDCAHLGDYQPTEFECKKIIKNSKNMHLREEAKSALRCKIKRDKILNITYEHETYRTIEFVTKELESLVDQIIKYNE